LIGRGIPEHARSPSVPRPAAGPRRLAFVEVGRSAPRGEDVSGDLAPRRAVTMAFDMSRTITVALPSTMIGLIIVPQSSRPRSAYPPAAGSLPAPKILAWPTWRYDHAAAAASSTQKA